jgi:HEAT repeat protein
MARSALLLFTVLAGLAAPVEAASLRDDALAGNHAAVKARGPAVMPQLVALYRGTQDPQQRATLAYVMYNLGWKSEDAKAALLEDVHTTDRALRLQVQWALGRVSNSPEVVDVLLENMREDPQPLFRDKAACALASDQIHLTAAQKVRLFAGLIDALEDEKPQVRQIALQALQVLTRQTKGYAAQAPPEARAQAVARWRAWLTEFSANTL